MSSYLRQALGSNVRGLNGASCVLPRCCIQRRRFHKLPNLVFVGILHFAPLTGIWQIYNVELGTLSNSAFHPRFCVLVFLVRIPSGLEHWCHLYVVEIRHSLLPKWLQHLELY